MTTSPAPENTGLRSDIKSALNRASAENPSGTPDHVLADYLLDCLAAFDKAQTSRSKWRGESVKLPALQQPTAVHPFTINEGGNS